jgi:N-acyl-D-aspartate/D-glutamate deacylase
MCRFCEQVAFGHDEAYDPQLGRGGFMPGANLPPDLILCDGPVITMNEAMPEATAVAIRQGVIQSVGRSDEVLARTGRATRIVRLEGRAVLPGFIGTAQRLPERRDRASLDAWIEGRARAGFTTVDVTSLGRNWAEYEGLSHLIDRRHRLRLRGAAEAGLRSDWQSVPLQPGHGNDLMRIETLRLDPRAAEGTVAEALALHAEGWGVVFDCLSDSDLAAAVHLAASASGRSLSGIRVLAARMPEASVAKALTAAGLALVAVAGDAPPDVSTDAPPDTPAEALVGPRDTVLQRIARLTRDAARVAGMSGIAGQIRAGYYADFVILDRSPLWPGDAPQVQGTWIEGVPVRPEADHVAA